MSANVDHRQVFDATRLLSLIGADPDTAVFLQEARNTCWFDAVTYVNVGDYGKPFAPRPYALVDVFTRGLLVALHAGEIDRHVALRSLHAPKRGQQYRREEVARWLRENHLHSAYAFDAGATGAAVEDPVRAARRRQVAVFREAKLAGATAREAARRAVAAVPPPAGWGERSLRGWDSSGTWPRWLDT